MSVMTSPKRAAREKGIEREAAEVLGRLQSAVRELIRKTPGITKRPADLTRTLGIHSKLAWQVHGLAHADDPLAEAGKVPGPAAMERFLKATEKRGAPATLVAAVRDAGRTYERLIDVHAGSRGEFDSIMSALAPDRSGQVDLTHKRAAFRAQSHFQGVQARTQLGTAIFKPSEIDPAKNDAVMIRGLVDLRRSRNNVSWILTSMRAINDDGSECALGEVESIAPPDESRGVGLLARYCSQPLPKMRRVQVSPGRNLVVVEPNGVGAKSMLTSMVGNVMRGAAPRYADAQNRVEVHSVFVRTPCEVLIHDTLVYRGDHESEPTVRVYSDHHQDTMPVVRESLLLPMYESVMYLGRGTSVLATADVPRYDDLARYVFERLGWIADDFDVWRCRVEYPVMPSSVDVQFDLPERPEP